MQYRAMKEANRRHLFKDDNEDSEDSLIRYLKPRAPHKTKPRLLCKHSRIHGLGVFANEPLKEGEMIMEYVGEVIRQSLTDKREQIYEARGIGCYMFRIDEDWIVDATMAGNRARFVNHSCEPNCFAKVINVDETDKIVLFSKRDIHEGEEITYDYNFAFEEEKLACYCGAATCRGSMN